MATQVSLVGNVPFTLAITIPDNADTTMKTIKDLIDAEGDAAHIEWSKVKHVKVGGYIPGQAGTARGAIVVASTRHQTAAADTDITSHGSYIPSGEAVDIASEKVQEMVIRAAGASDVSALVEILY